MAKIKSFGADVYINGIAVGGLTDISASGTDVSMIGTTSHDTAGGFQTFVAGLKDGGTLELTGKYNYADAGQAEWKAEEGVSHAFYIILSDNSGLAFNAVVGGFQTSNPLDDAVEFTASAKITGEVYPVFPTITISGVATSGINGDLVFAGFSGGYILWSTDGTSTPGGSNTILTRADSGATWATNRSGVFVATKSSSSLIPQGLTSWTVILGSGTPTLTGS